VGDECACESKTRVARGRRKPKVKEEEGREGMKKRKEAETSKRRRK
jgi:hypothetical protein